MTVSNARILTALGGALLLLGIFLGLQKLEYREVPCGSAFNPNVNLEAMDYLYDNADRVYCADKTGSRQPLAVGIIVLGVAGLGGGLYGLKKHDDALRASAGGSGAAPSGG